MRKIRGNLDFEITILEEKHNIDEETDQNFFDAASFFETSCYMLRMQYLL